MKLITLSLIFILIISPLSAWALTVDDVARELICNCGCGKMLDACEMKSCAGAMKIIIREKIDEGWSKKRIEKYFVRMYGEKILAAPTKKGFNLTAWITPFVALAVGGLIISFVIVGWVRKREVLTVEDKEDAGVKREVEDKYRKELDEELKEFDR